MFNVRFIASAVLSAFALTVLAGPTTQLTLPLKVNKVIDANFADPSISYFNGGWYAYATTGNGVNAQVAISRDGQNWSLLKGLETLPNPGIWADQRYPGIWAPDVVHVGNGKYVMYYSAKFATLNRHCIGAAVADLPTGPFRALGSPLACHLDQGGAIDAAGYYEGGMRYVVYKVDGNNVGGGGSCNNGVRPLQQTPIMLQQVSPFDGVSLLGRPVVILDRDDRDGPLVEAPSLARLPDGRYVLFYSSNCYTDSSYDIAYAFADRITGPYVKAARFAVTGMAGLYAPGSADVSPDGRRLVFHASDLMGGRVMFTARIAVDSNRRLVYSF